MTSIIGVRFTKVGRLYHFDAGDEKDLQSGDFVLVETSRGIQIGQTIGFIDTPPLPPKGVWKQIMRKASAQDLIIREKNKTEQIKLMVRLREIAREKNLHMAKIVDVDMSFDQKKLTIIYSTEQEEDVDLAPVIRKFRQEHTKYAVDISRTGPRDAAKMIGGIGPCGVVERCCSRFLSEFSPISIKMAKNQGISLDPAEITGMCGRLRCCLVYENQAYVDGLKGMPKMRKIVDTPMGKGKVIDRDPLRGKVTLVLMSEGTYHTFESHELHWEGKKVEIPVILPEENDNKFEQNNETEEK